MGFNPNDHLVNVAKDGKPPRLYLPVKWRLVWFRLDHPDYGIVTTPEHFDAQAGIAMFRAHVLDAEGRILASGHALETRAGFPDFVEKAESCAIGRALGMLGYGTQFAPELDEGPGRVVDGPAPAPESSGDCRAAQAVQSAERSQTYGDVALPPAPPKPEGDLKLSGEPAGCASCRKALTKGQHDVSMRAYGKPLCPAHQKEHARQETAR